jgi:hypothetical protein
LAEDKPVGGLYTFGSPRVGDRIFAQNFNNQFQGSKLSCFGISIAEYDWLLSIEDGLYRLSGGCWSDAVVQCLFATIRSCSIKLVSAYPKALRATLGRPPLVSGQQLLSHRLGLDENSFGKPLATDSTGAL